MVLCVVHALCVGMFNAFCFAYSLILFLYSCLLSVVCVLLPLLVFIAVLALYSHIIKNKLFAFNKNTLQNICIVLR